MRRLKLPDTSEQGQMMVTLLVFIVIALTVTTTGTYLLIDNMKRTAAVGGAYQAQLFAESSLENALLQLLRNPNYSGETLTLDDSTATIEVSGDSLKQISVQVESAGFSRRYQVLGLDDIGVLEVQSWKEIH